MADVTPIQAYLDRKGVLCSSEAQATDNNAAYDRYIEQAVVGAAAQAFYAIDQTVKQVGADRDTCVATFQKAFDGFVAAGCVKPPGT